MREDYNEDKGFNPLKLGLIGALIVAGIIAVLLQFGASSNNEGSPEQSTAAAPQIQQYQTQNKELKERVAELEEVTKVTADNLEKQLKQKDLQIASLKKEKSSGDQSTSSKLTWLRKENGRLESELTKLKGEIDSKSNETKVSQDKFAALETELRNARFELERQQRNSRVLKEKLDGINNGDEAAADVMVQQLAEARQELKREKARSQRLEEELDDLREQMGITQQQQQ